MTLESSLRLNVFQIKLSKSNQCLENKDRLERLMADNMYQHEFTSSHMTAKLFHL